MPPSTKRSKSSRSKQTGENNKASSTPTKKTAQGDGAKKHRIDSPSGAESVNVFAATTLDDHRLIERALRAAREPRKEIDLSRVRRLMRRTRAGAMPASYYAPAAPAWAPSEMVVFDKDPIAGFSSAAECRAYGTAMYGTPAQIAWTRAPAVYPALAQQAQQQQIQVQMQQQMQQQMRMQQQQHQQQQQQMMMMQQLLAPPRAPMPLYAGLGGTRLQ